MNPLVEEIQSALGDIQDHLSQGKSLSERELQTLLLVALAEEASHGES
tara:strand:- start:9647 stop:9790 length:144 start_codon:yes stop_codon:yes gene_type:complete